MIKVNKPKTTPIQLQKVQQKIAAELLEKKEKFKWRNEHYSEPIKDDLKTIYNNKCAFCEIELSEFNHDNKFTVEHYRPKTHYYWLGAEWTNLFPTCQGCNGNKKDDFPLFQEKNRIKNPLFYKKGGFLKKSAKSTYKGLLSEEPLFLHPEIDNPQKYFEINEHGKADVKPNLGKYEAQRARIMCQKFLNRASIEERRKRKILLYKNKLLDLLVAISQKDLSNLTSERIEDLFLSFFLDLKRQANIDSEFSLLGYYMLTNFNAFFLNYIEKIAGGEARKLVNYAYQIHFRKHTSYSK